MKFEGVSMEREMKSKVEAHRRQVKKIDIRGIFFIPFLPLFLLSFLL